MALSRKAKVFLCSAALALSHALPISPVLAQESLNKAVAAYNKNDFATCITLLSQDIKGPLKNNPYAHYYYASAALRTGQNIAAAEHYLETSRLAPGTVYDAYSKKALQTIMPRAGNLPEHLKQQYKRQNGAGQSSSAESTATEGTSSSTHETRRARSKSHLDETNDPTLASATLKDVDSSFIAVHRHTADTDHALIQICRALKLVPKQIVEDLKSGGITVLVAPTVLEAMPGSAMERPRGYVHGGGYSNAGALFHSPQIVIGERVSYLSGVPQPNERIASAMLHEMGHAYDHVRGGLSNKGKFKDLYQQDFSHLTNSQRTKHAYFTQEDGAGASELFAQLFSYEIYNNQVASSDKAADLQATFPQCTKYMSALVKSNR